MLELFWMGGSLFMGLLTIELTVMLAYAIYQFLQISKQNTEEASNLHHKLSYVKSIGLFALITGLLGQFIGLFEAFKVIEKLGEVSAEMLAGGLKVSSITSIYGLLIFLVSYLVWFIVDSWAMKKVNG